jgi:hypothetical protein
MKPDGKSNVPCIRSDERTNPFGAKIHQSSGGLL